MRNGQPLLARETFEMKGLEYYFYVPLSETMFI